MISKHSLFFLCFFPSFSVLSKRAHEEGHQYLSWKGCLKPIWSLGEGESCQAVKNGIYVG